MDIQLKRGMLDVCVLAAIKDEDSYGYQIIKDMKPFVPVFDIGIYTVSDPAKTGSRRIPHRSLRRTQRTASEILSYYRCGQSTNRGIQRRMERT